MDGFCGGVQKITRLPDCSLRQGAGGTKTARFGFKTCFRGDFIIVLNHFSTRNLKNTLKLSKNIMWRSNTTIFDKKVLRNKRCVLFFDFSCSSRAGAGPIWAHTGPYGPIWALMGPYGPEISRKINEKSLY